MINIQQKQLSLNKKYNFIYLTTNLLNKKQYIGQHRTDNLKDCYLGSGKLLKRAIKKYGRKNFKLEIMQFCNTQEELNFLEQQYIIWYETLIPSGYNLCSGGKQCYSHNTETIEKIREARKRQIIKHSDETKRKISEAHKGKKLSSETIEKMLGREPFSKNKIACYNIENNELLYINSVEELPNGYLLGLGNRKFRSYTLEDAQKQKEFNQKHKSFYNKELDKVIKIDISVENYIVPDGFVIGGRPLSEDKRNNLKNKVWIYNKETGENKMINKDSVLPEGFDYGLKRKVNNHIN